MRNLARNIHLSIENDPGEDMLTRLQGVIELLDSSPVPESADAGG